MGHQCDNYENGDLPSVLVLGPPPVLRVFGERFSRKFNLLKAWESPLPLDQFLISKNAQSVQAILCSGATPVNAELIGQLPHLGLVVTDSSGVNHIDLSECQTRGIAVTNAGNVYADDVADMAVGLLINVLRKISAADRYLRNGVWPVIGTYPLGSKLGGKRVGIVGLGSIGLKIAKRLKGFDCSILYNSKKEKPSISYPFYSDVCELAANSDVLIICCALTDETRHIINKEVFSALGKEGVIINVGRGLIIDEKEMVRCVVEGEIGGAGLDVFENEPEVPKELYALDNVVISPHRAAFTPESCEEVFNIVMGNLEAFFSYKPLVTPVLDGLKYKTTQGFLYVTS
ncbi:hypothetical protein REPUB_Repub17cG0169300 [Reevesia pubescens]